MRLMQLNLAAWELLHVLYMFFYLENIHPFSISSSGSVSFSHFHTQVEYSVEILTGR